MFIYRLYNNICYYLLYNNCSSLLYHLFLWSALYSKSWFTVISQFYQCYITIALVYSKSWFTVISQFYKCYYLLYNKCSSLLYHLFLWSALTIVSPGLLLSLSSISVIICYITIALVCFITCFYGQPSKVSPGLLLSLSSISVNICYITIALVCFITCFYGQPSIVSPG